MQTRSKARKSRAAAVVAVAAIGALALVSGAAATPQAVRDAKFDTAYLSKHGRLDVIRAWARRHGSEVSIAVTMRARVQPARDAERPSIAINTRGGKRSDYELIVLGSTVFRVPKQGAAQPVGSATLAAKGRTWRYRFDLAELPQTGGGWGWAALTQKRSGRLADVAPDDGYAKNP